MATESTFDEIFKQCKASGVSPEGMVAGDGPDVMLQRVGSRTEIAINQDSIGQKRIPEGDAPEISKVLDHVVRQSYWKSIDSLAGLSEKFPKKKPPQALHMSSGLGIRLMELIDVRKATVQEMPVAKIAPRKIMENPPNLPFIDDRWDHLG